MGSAQVFVIPALPLMAAVAAGAGAFLSCEVSAATALLQLCLDSSQDQHLVCAGV